MKPSHGLKSGFFSTFTRLSSRFHVVIALGIGGMAYAEHRVVVDSRYPEWFGTNSVGNVAGEGLYTNASSVTTSVDRVVMHPTDPRKRVVVTGTSSKNPEYVAFSASQSGNVGPPLRGVGANSTNYFLVNPGTTGKLERDFDGNNQESYAFDNPDTAKDGASLDENHMLQLGTGNGIYKVRLSDGEQILINGSPGIYAGANTFGIGYNAASNTIGIGQYSNDEMTFRIYDLNIYAFTDRVTFPFSTNKYGIPTGLDYIVNSNSQPRILVSTKEGSPDVFGARNFILDMSPHNGQVDKYSTTMGTTWKLQDVLFDDRKMILVKERTTMGDGRVQVGNYTPHSD